MADACPVLPEGTTGVNFPADLVGNGQVDENQYIGREETGGEGVPTFADDAAALDLRLFEEARPCAAEPLNSVSYAPDDSESHYSSTPASATAQPAAGLATTDPPSVAIADEDAAIAREDEGQPHGIA